MIARLAEWTKDAWRNKTIFHPLRSPHWPAKRREHLQKNPNCAACGQADHVQVHHVRPFHLWPELELVDANLISLCEQKAEGNDHFRLGHKGNWKDYNPRVREDAAEAFEKLHTAPHEDLPPK